MGMPAARRFRADQRTAREREAFLRVNMLSSGAGLRREAALIMRMRPDLRQRAPKIPVFIGRGRVKTTAITVFLIKR